ncbi:paralemmin 1a isoform X2 [Anabas testudineus]|uniref:paralemmin 1a isoform X2 n=1 Tax=Anabas testudineus TaxID=64144 RepID=UPI000E45B5C5|nr:paralemmin 1a isoform X2 [Anabas testudineus]
METVRASEALCQEERLQLIAEKRKWQTEIDKKKQQLEDDRRALQHLKSKALRERWLLDGAGPEQDEVKRQLEQDEAKTRTLEDTINRLEKELISLETGAVCQTITHTTVSSGSVKEVKGHSNHLQDRAAAQVVKEVKVHKSPRVNKPREATEEMKTAMYSVEIKVERDRLTGETRVLSTNTMLPVDLTEKGVKVYEDERKVVHEMNGEDGIHLLSSSEVDELIHKADKASVISQTGATVTVLPKAEVQEEAAPPSEPYVAVEITGLETRSGGEPSMAEASAENPVTMVFMGFQSVDDEDETKKVLGLQGKVKAELVLIEDSDGKTSPGEEGKEETVSAQTTAPPPGAAASTTQLPSSKHPETTAGSNGETAGEVERGAVEIKEKQPCKCCSIM